MHHGWRPTLLEAEVALTVWPLLLALGLEIALVLAMMLIRAAVAAWRRLRPKGRHR